MKIKKKIIVTHWDHNIDTEVFTIKGKTEKRLILDVYYKSDKILYALGEGDEFMNKVWEGELNKDELMEIIPFETLDEFLKDLNTKSKYYFREK